jgi:hypothetical protein
MSAGARWLAFAFAKPCKSMHQHKSQLYGRPWMRVDGAKKRAPMALKIFLEF